MIGRLALYNLAVLIKYLHCSRRLYIDANQLCDIEDIDLHGNRKCPDDIVGVCRIRHFGR